MTEHPLLELLDGPFAAALPALIELGQARHLEEDTCLALLLAAQKVARERANGIEQKLNPAPDAIVIFATVLLSHLGGHSPEEFGSLVKRIQNYLGYLIQSIDADPPLPAVSEERLATHVACLIVAYEYMTTLSPYRGGTPPLLH